MQVHLHGLDIGVR